MTKNILSNVAGCFYIYRMILNVNAIKMYVKCVRSDTF